MDDALRESIAAAFRDGQPPTRPINGHRCLECDEVDALLGGRIWASVVNDFPGSCHDAWPLLTKAAKKYYLPAFMVVALGPDCGLQGISLESELVGGELMPEDFSADQRRAIAAWIKSYWELIYPWKIVPSNIAAKWGVEES